MSDLEVILRLSAVALLGAWLYVRRLQRLARQGNAPPGTWEARQTGTAFDATMATTRIQALRRDYVAGLHPHATDLQRRALLVASARQTLARLAYFHRFGTEDLEPEARVHAGC